MSMAIAALLFALASPGFDTCLLEASQSGYWHITPFGGAWDLAVPPDAPARLVVHDPDADRLRSITVSEGRRQELSAALSAADFMSLEDPAFQWIVPDEDTRSIRVRCGDDMHEVTFGSTRADVSQETTDRVERFSRALRVWVAIRNLFDDDEAADTRPEDLRFLKEHPFP